MSLAEILFGGCVPMLAKVADPSKQFFSAPSSVNIPVIPRDVRAEKQPMIRHTVPDDLPSILKLLEV
jgi:hypothetical protein